MIIEFFKIQTFVDGIIVTQWYQNGTPVIDDLVPITVQKKCCDGCCGGGSGTGTVDVTTLDFSGLPVFDNTADATVTVGKMFTLVDNNNQGFPKETVFVKK